ncbi:transcriptional regulator, LacI family [Paenibacillus uliginis N3/975]|uniref:Transcriptional regulator, LacI family n=1 Tax=Paenibacillus uliginis N3/975 TaxID=1313296 RepID=A0A1X7H1S7_9BACL|nr:LacI family DNA-binding transcriptional regulator [Paenibacillus uliginis]SMF77427.1 transcriptional regulator, LacI family [Paenibacillus uliginis N3/975]
MTKLKDIAERVGVSISTVSRAISNDASRPVSEETKQKIREAALELGYKQHEPSRNANDNNAAIKRIACIVPQLLMDDHPYFSKVLVGFHKKMEELGQPPAIVRTCEEVNDAEKIRLMLRETGAQGIVAISWYDEELFEQIQQDGVVIMGVSLNDERLTVPVVDCDRILSARAAVRHLIDQGHTRIAYIGGPAYSKQMESEERFVGYKFAMLEANLQLREEWLMNTRWNVDRSFSKMSELLGRLPKAEWPTAVFCASDMLAIPAMRAVVENHGSIPEDIAIVGMDNIDVAQYTTPPLTSVSVPKYEIGRVAAKSIVDYLDGHFPMATKILLPCSLIIRESSSFSRI